MGKIHEHKTFSFHLDVFEINLSRRKPINFNPDSIDFVFDSFWYNRDWSARITLNFCSVYSVYYRSKYYLQNEICVDLSLIFYSRKPVQKHESSYQTQKLIHFIDKHPQFECSLSPSYDLTIDNDDVEIVPVCFFLTRKPIFQTYLSDN